MNPKLAELYANAVSESADFETYKNSIVGTIARAPEDACQTIIRAIKRTIKSRSETPTAKLKALKVKLIQILHACMLTNNSNFITYTGKKIMRRLTVLAKHKKESSDPKRGYNLFGNTSTNNIQNQQVSIEFLTTLLEYIKTWAEKFGSAFLKSYDTLIKEKVAWPPSQPKAGRKLAPPNISRSIVSLQDDMTTCVEAANELKTLMNSGYDISSRKVRSLVKRVQGYKNQIEAHIETGLGGDIKEDGLNVLLYTNDILGEAIKAYESASHSQGRPISDAFNAITPSLSRPGTSVHKPSTPKNPKNLADSRDISEFNTMPVRKLPRDKLEAVPGLEVTPKKPRRSRVGSQSVIINEPAPKPIPDPPSNNSSITEDSCMSPAGSVASPMRFDNSSFSQSMKFEFTLDDRQFLDTPDRSLTSRNPEDSQEYMKKVEELTALLRNQETALEVQTHKLQKKSERLKELKKTKFELDAYITSINSKYEKLKEETISLKETQEHITALKQLIEQKETRIEENMNQIKDMEDYIEDMKKLVVSKETEIVQKNEQISESEVYIEELKSLIETKEAEREELESVIRTKERYVEDMKDEVNAKSGLMREISEELSAKEEANQRLLKSVKNHSDRILKYKRKIDTLKAKLEERDKELDEARVSIGMIKRLDDRPTDRRTVTVMLQTPKIRTVPSTPQNESIFARYIDHCRDSVSKSQEFLTPARRHTISPATIAFGDSESAQLNESDLSQDENNISISPDAENNENKSETASDMQETATSGPQPEPPLRNSTQTDLTRTSFVSVYMEEPHIINECSPKHPFKSPAESSEVITNSPFLFHHSEDLEIKPDNLDMYRFCVNRLRGMLYSSDELEVGIQISHEQGIGTAQLYIGNKSDYSIENLESRVVNKDPDNLEIEISCEFELRVLEKMEKLERLISFKITGELIEPPILILKYLSNNTLFKLNLLLPITVALCFSAYSIDATEISTEWMRYKYLEKIREFQGLQEHIKSMRELAWFLHLGGAVRIFSYKEVETLSQRSIIFACIYRGAKVLYMVTLNESATGGEIALRSEDSKLQDCILPLLMNLIS